MFYGPIVGGLITQHLSFEWAAAVQGGLAFLAVSIIIYIFDVLMCVLKVTLRVVSGLTAYFEACKMLLCAKESMKL